MDERIDSIEELLSRRPDGELTADEAAEVRRVMAEDSSAASVASAYERLDSVLRAWRHLPPDLNWDGLSARIAEQIDQDISPVGSSDAVDDLLAGWTGPLPEVDWDGFKARVSDAVRREAATSASTGRGGRSWGARVRWLAPLAAAAVIALAVWLPRGTLPIAGDLSVAPRPIVVVSLDFPVSRGTISFVFDESPLGVEDEPARSAGGSAIAIGAGRFATGGGVGEAYFY